MIFLIICAILFGLSAGICWGLAPLCANAARRMGLVDNPGERKIHTAAVPYGGGIAIMGAMVLVVATAYLIITCAPDWLPVAWREFIAPHLDGLTENTTLRRLLCLFGGAGCVFTLGLVDDCRPLPPRLKLFIQIAAAALTWYGGVRVLPELGTAMSLLITVGWIVVITNAFNLLDNMDGLSAGVAMFASLSLFAIMCGKYYFTAAMISVFAGSLAGFLPRNFSAPPAKLFMGDAGALFTGYFLATLSIAGNYYADRGLTHALLMPLILLGVPLFDTASVVIIRLRNHKPLMVGDTNHLSHRLVRRGFTRRRAVGIIYLLSIILGLLAQLLAQLNSSGVIITFAAVVITIMLMAALMAGDVSRPAEK